VTWCWPLPIVEVFSSRVSLCCSSVIRGYVCCVPGVFSGLPCGREV
jgi:hypothetical protein